jgi:hypothetical protein
VDRLRAAARLAVEAQSHAQLGQAGAELAGGMQRVGLGNWRRFTARAEERAVEAVSKGEVPGVVRASAENTGIDLGVAILLFLGTLYFAKRDAQQGDAPSPEAPGIVRQDAPKEEPPGNGPASKEEKDQQADDGRFVLPDDRKRYILDGDGKGGGGHRYGTGLPGKGEFPGAWSDDKIVDAIVSVANDKNSSRSPAPKNRTEITLK